MVKAPRLRGTETRRGLAIKIDCLALDRDRALAWSNRDFLLAVERTHVASHALRVTRQTDALPVMPLGMRSTVMT
jgi:hypothetical protein